MKKQEQLSLFDDEMLIDKEIVGKEKIEKVDKDEKETITHNRDTQAHHQETSFGGNISMSVREKEMAQVSDTTISEIDPYLLKIRGLLAEMENSFSSEQQSLLHSTFKQYLQTLIERRYFTHIDLYFAEFIAGQTNSDNARTWLGYWLLLLLVSRAYGFGHTALPFSFLERPSAWFVENDDSARLDTICDLLMMVFDEHVFQGQGALSESLLSPISVVRAKSLSEIDLTTAWQPIVEMIDMPLIKTGHGVYLDRNYQQETVIIDFFKNIEEMPLTEREICFLKERLDHYFKVDGEINWQKFAAANAILNSVSVISGGPGTGKTTTVFKILQTLVDLHHQRTGLDDTKPFTILLAAPTGKAAARLSESILGQVRQLSDAIATEDEATQLEVRQQLALIPYKGQTLHRLLMIHPFTRKPKFNHFNPLNFDVLVVDEASMIDQQMLVQLMNALPPSGRVIFLGDKDQLSSVEAGAIMHELCVQENYSQQHFQHLSKLMGQPLIESEFVNPSLPAFNYLSFLKKSYRFKSDSALGDLAKLVNNEGKEKLMPKQQYAEIMALFQKSRELSPQAQCDGNLLQLQSLPMEQQDLAKIIAVEFKAYLQILPRNSGLDFAEKAFTVFNQLGVLSARRTGEYGALSLNDLIRKTLFPRDAHREFFHGLPIMITHNSVENNLFNGDVGLILNNESGTLSAYFEGVDSARVFSIHSLPKFEPAFAMTIHKSQGSEFARILLFLGVEGSAFLTKELFYTGITRAKKGVHIFANDSALKAALAGRVDRYSFIHTRLREEV